MNVITRIYNGFLAAGSFADHSIQLINLTTFTVNSTLTGHLTTLNTIAQISSSYLVSCDNSGIVKLWSMNTYEAVQSYNVSADGDLTAFTNVSDTLVAIATRGSNVIKLMDITTGLLVNNLTGSTGITCLLNAVSANVLASASSDNYMFLWDIQSGGLTRKISMGFSHPTYVNRLLMLSNELIASSCTRDSAFRTFNSTTGDSVYNFTLTNSTTGSLTLLSTGILIFSDGFNSLSGTGYFIDSKTGNILATMPNKFGNLVEIFNGNFVDINPDNKGGSALRFWS